MSVVTLLVAVRPRWRHVAPWVVLVDAAVVVLALAAKESGERLQARLQQLDPSVADQHSRDARLVPYLAVAVFVAALLVWVTQRFPSFVPLAVVLALVAGVGGVWWT